MNSLRTAATRLALHGVSKRNANVIRSPAQCTLQARQPASLGHSFHPGY
jgi:hypothetical protein